MKLLSNMADNQQDGADTLSSAFTSLAEQARDSLAPYRPALAKLNAIVSKFHAQGNSQIGIELATFDKLRENNLFRQPIDNSCKVFSILSVYDARFLIRVMAEGKIDCYTENLNKPYGAIFNIDSDAFWQTAQDGTSRTMFSSYDLSQDGGVENFTKAIMHIDAIMSANNALREFDVPAARTATPLPKGGVNGLKLHK